MKARDFILRGSIMSLSYFANEIKNRLDTVEVFEYYGFHPNRKGFVCCPFHAEKTPSMKVYAGNRGYNCFGCGENGGIIDFVMKMFDLPLKDAINKLNNDFNVGLPIGEKLDRRKQLDISKRAFIVRKEREKKKQQEDEVKNAYYSALDEWIRLDNQRVKHKPKKQDIPLHPLFVEAIIKLPHAEYKLECAEVELYLYETRNRNNT